VFSSECGAQKNGSETGWHGDKDKNSEKDVPQMEKNSERCESIVGYL
jgi:hypothetical protein